MEFEFEEKVVIILNLTVCLGQVEQIDDVKWSKRWSNAFIASQPFISVAIFHCVKYTWCLTEMNSYFRIDILFVKSQGLLSVCFNDVTNNCGDNFQFSCCLLTSVHFNDTSFYGYQFLFILSQDSGFCGVLNSWIILKHWNINWES